MGRLAGCVLIVGACFSPQPPTGAPCPDGVCPSGLVCTTTTMTCEKPGTGGMVDAPPGATDAAIEDTPPTPDGNACYGGAFLQICPAEPVTQPLSIVNSTTIDTNTSPSCIAYTGASNGFCVIAGTTVSVSKTLHATGSKPLVVLATQSITVTGMGGAIDVSSPLGQTPGAGANPAACGTPTAAVGQQGAAGGSFGGVGGRGADLESVNGPTAAPATALPVTTLRGGCKGGSGAGQQLVQGGNGGGAVILIAQSITVMGTINASGGGGAGAVDRSGGGGGGSGGMIVLEAASIDIAASGRVYANGGGGGEGGTLNHDGTRGADPSSASTAAVGGGDTAPHGGNGGAGTTGTNRDGAGGSVGNQCGGAGTENGKGGGGGGGGGAAGVVRTFAASSTVAGTISPPAN